MLYHIFFAFVIPWIFGIWLYNKNDRIVLTIAPAFSVIATIIDHWGISNGFWQILPIFNDKSLSSLPYDIGLFPILACLLVYLIHLNKHAFFWIIVISITATSLEVINLLLGKVIYGNGWNIIFTYVSYLIPNFLVFLYYRFLKSKGFY
ncbi:hypothetical protein EDM56_21235 [Brevibacillus fluminis]|uniref:Uncharacterized protein n=1 Tax=Brevibacillus fluminis TaxID=511487 RepID=A0A3M8DAL3_9BACL|nr:CBO0543 family protein [Brevibacillus fluminis]RNB84631.1 hypothetical protein EDM56_21235 [Brevibacillus fluminis]